jgi:hypothetical protein
VDARHPSDRLDAIRKLFMHERVDLQALAHEKNTKQGQQQQKQLQQQQPTTTTTTTTTTATKLPFASYRLLELDLLRIAACVGHEALHVFVIRHDLLGLLRNAYGVAVVPQIQVAFDKA